jgi:hypothetical protein
MYKTIEATLSKKGHTCSWEKGGGYSNTGNSTIITNADGTPPIAIHIQRSGPLACAEHALIPVSVGMYIIETEHHRCNFTIKIAQIVGVNGDKLTLSHISEFSFRQWDIMPPTYLQPAIEAAMAKAKHYHCRRHYWAVEINNRF